MSDDSGTLTIKYLPFGDWRFSSGSIPTDQKFTGQRLDDTSLYYYGACYYDADLGRFISPDTVIPDPSNSQALNRYSYCFNNPLKFNDPTGHWPNWGTVLKIATIVVAIAIVAVVAAPVILPMITAAVSTMAATGISIAATVFGGTAAAVTLAAEAPALENELVSGGETIASGTEIVQRAMSLEELQSTMETGLIRGGREGVHFVSDAINSDPLRAIQRLALEDIPDVRVTMEVPEGVFSESTKVAAANGMQGGGLERMAVGNIPIKILDWWYYKGN
ncbi:MAG: RHS repeat-associated core domain-containing protein [Chloroflexi bacterium]|nr:RHS repeat-associated core domain-containing protein [Chloroflexota bacterium]